MVISAVWVGWIVEAVPGAKNWEVLLRHHRWLHKRRLRRNYGWVYEAENFQPAERWALRFVPRFPGLVGPEHFERGLGLYLPGAEND